MEHNREVEIDGNSNPIQISRLALDIGGTFTHTHIIMFYLSFFCNQSKAKKCWSCFAGSLIKLVFFSRNSGDDEDPPKDLVGVSSGVNGRLHFAKFETAKINDCLQFISANKLLLGGGMCTLLTILVGFFLSFCPSHCLKL